MQRDVHQLVQMHRRFWSMEHMGQPLWSILDARVRPLPLEAVGARVMPDDVDLAGLLVHTQSLWTQYASIPFADDVFTVTEPPTNVPWLEAICGCPLASEGSAIHALPAVASPEDVGSIVWDPDNPWLRRYIDVLAKLQLKFEGRFPVVQTDLTADLDLFYAMLGDAAPHCLHSDPDASRSMIDRIGKLYSELVRMTLTYSDPLDDGYISSFGIWTAGRPLRFACRHMGDLTDEQYDAIVRPTHEKLCMNFSTTFFEVDQHTLPLIDRWLTLPFLSAVHADLSDCETPDAFLPELKRIQQSAKPLILTTRATGDVFEALLRGLEPRGLCVRMPIDSLLQAIALRTQAMWSFSQIHGRDLG